jgi:hypothetical protein
MRSTADATSTTDETVVVLATALERLIAQVTQQLDPDAGESVPIEDSAWAATHAQVVAVARECAGVLDDPRVVDTLVPH